MKCKGLYRCFLCILLLAIIAGGIWWFLKQYEYREIPKDGTLVDEMNDTRKKCMTHVKDTIENCKEDVEEGYENCKEDLKDGAHNMKSKLCGENQDSKNQNSKNQDCKSGMC